MAKRKKKRFSIKKTLKIILPLTILILLIANFNNIKTFYISKTTGYNENTVTTFLEDNIYSQIKKNEYSETLDKIINTNYYQEKYLKEYLFIKYYEKENFFENINNLLSIGYTSTDINTIYEKLNNESLEIILNNGYIKDISNFINLNYFKEDYLKRYIDYYQKESKDPETTLIYVNIGLDNEYYTNVSEIEDQNNILVLVNKYNVLQSDYVPKDLETISSKYGTGKLRKEARIAFEEMCENAKKDGITIYAGSGYRSYSYQKSLYNTYVAKDGKVAAETYSARPGYSEHQTGLAMDIKNALWSYIDKTDKEYTWLINNSYKYGYILRYPEGKENITGYMYEEWHYRYVGKEVAKEIYELGITYDEYIAKK